MTQSAIEWDCWGAQTVVRASLPLPPSVNHLYRRYRGRVVLVREARAYRTAVGLLLASADIPRPRPDQQWGLEAQLVVPAQAGDIDNRLKVLLDAVAAALGSDDRRCVRLVATRATLRPGEEPHVIVCLYWPELPSACAWCRKGEKGEYTRDTSRLCFYHDRQLWWKDVLPRLAGRRQEE